MTQHTCKQTETHWKKIVEKPLFVPVVFEVNQIIDTHQMSSPVSVFQIELTGFTALVLSVCMGTALNRLGQDPAGMSRNCAFTGSVLARGKPLCQRNFYGLIFEGYVCVEGYDQRKIDHPQYLDIWLAQ